MWPAFDLLCFNFQEAISLNRFDTGRMAVLLVSYKPLSPELFRHESWQNSTVARRLHPQNGTLPSILSWNERTNGSDRRTPICRHNGQSLPILRACEVCALRENPNWKRIELLG
jgi:hypothetical protein